MGKIEELSRENTRRANIQKAVLQTVATAGVLGVALLAPNALQMFKLFDGKKKRMFQQAINTSRRRLVEKGLLLYKDGLLQLTEKGKERLKDLERNNYRLAKPKRWDKKWRALSFDIPEKQKNLREKVRTTLISIGFRHLHDSLWVYPYDCEDFVTLLKADFKIGRNLLYLIVDNIENDRELKEFFGV